MQYRYWLNGVLLKNEPGGWENKISTIHRDYSIKGILRLQEGNLVFKGDGYNRLKQIDSTSGYTEQVEVVEEKSIDYGNNWRLSLRGIIFVAQIDWDDKRNFAKCTVQDNGYNAKIFNNKNLDFHVPAGKSKNGIDITIPTTSDVRLFNPVDGVYYTPLGGFGECQAYYAFDIFKYLVSAMTDDQVDFASTLFDVGGDRYKTYVTTGRSVRTYNDGCSASEFIDFFPKISFLKFSQEMDRLKNLFFIIESGSSGRPVFRLEEYDYFFKTDTVIHSCTDLDELKTKTDLQRIYSKVKFGSSVILDDPSMSHPADINYEGWKLEDYLIVGKGNIDKDLDLTTSYIKDSNTIEDILRNNNDAHDKEIVLIEGQAGVTYARASNWIINTGPPFFYNESYRNHIVAEQFLKAVPNSIADYLGTGHTEFRAQSTSDLVLTNADDLAYTVVPHQNDSTLGNFDVVGAYDNALGRFVIPASGYYKFDVSGQIDFNYTSGSPYSVIAIVATRYNSGMVFISRKTIFYKFKQTVLPNPTLDYSGFFSTNANLNDVIVVEAYSNVSVVTPASPNTWTIRTGALFFSGFSSNGGGIFNRYNPDDYSIGQHEFKDTLTEEQFEAIDADPRGLIEFGIANKLKRKGWIEKIQFHHSKSQADFLLDSNKTINKP